MRRRRTWLAVPGVLLLGLAVVALALAGGTRDAADTFREGQAAWQRGLEPARPVARSLRERTGEKLLGIDARSDVLRAYQDYRAGLADRIPGTTYPQTRARFEVLQRLRRLRTTLADDRDRASVDTVLGVVLVDDAAGAGQQRRAQLEQALAVFARAVREDPGNSTAKLDLELVLRSLTPSSKARPTPAGTPSRQRQREGNPRTPTSPPRAEGNGF